uniref:Phosphotransferase n=1 Tax=Glossina palpalis gambiensis TaxID=67801 RepID=A0A1B0AKT7_9MUSC
MSASEEETRLNEILTPFEITKEEMFKIKDLILKELKLGLNADTHSTANTKCYPTYIQTYPSGCEHGMFLVTTIYSLKVHVLFFHLKGENDYRLEEESFDIPESINQGVELFDFIVEKLHKHVKNLQLEREPLPLTLILPYPLLQINFAGAILLKFPKNLKIAGIENKDVGQMMRESMRRLPNIKFELTAIINDVTSAFMSAAWRHKNVRISFIVGTATNAGYWEKVSNIESVTHRPKPEMFVNTDIAEFGSSGQLEFLATEFDEALEKISPTKGQNIFEKMASAWYMSELSRSVIIKCISENILFGGESHVQLNRQDALKFANIQGTLVESDQFHYMALVLDKLGINLPSETDCARIHQIMEKIVMRSASLVAAAIVALIEQIDEPDIKIGLDGEVCNTRPIYHNMIRSKIDSILNPKYKYELVEANDEHGRGGAITASLILQEDYIYENLNTA